VVDLLVAPDGATTLTEALAAVRSAKRMAPFDPAAVTLVSGVAGKILADPASRALPDLVAFAYWMRRTRIDSLRKGFLQEVGGDVAAARGTILHYAPSNVDTIFAYSWMLSVLAGNANVVRVSRRRDRTAEILLDNFRAALREPEGAAIRERTVVISFDHDDEINRALSASCDLRVIWGGDETIRSIREAPLAPSATDLVFPDRFSLAVFSAASFLAMDGAAWERFTHDFANDVLTYGQMACSSPRFLAWVGSAEDRARARSLFWEKFLEVMRQRDAADWSQPVSSRLTLACRAALHESTVSAEVGLETPVTIVEIGRLTAEMREVHPGGGCFYEAGYETLNALAPDVVAKDQTIVHHGFAREELAAFAASLPFGGGDRIVPVGSALQFSHVWDGQDLLHAFTRRIALAV
jgi:hypothetical protein